MMKSLTRVRWATGLVLAASILLLIAGCTLLQSSASFANFQATPTQGTTPQRVNFTPTSTGSGVSYLWDFGDGTTSSEPAPSHIYRTAGTYTVSLTVHLDDGAVAHAVKNDLIQIKHGFQSQQYGPLVWLDRSTKTISSGLRTGGQVTTIVQAPPYQSLHSIAVANGKVYWTTDGTVERCNLDGTGQETIVSIQGASSIQGGFDGIAVDGTAGKVYWTVAPIEYDLSTYQYVNTRAKIWRANLDGSDAQAWVNTGAYFGNDVPDLLAVDPGNSHLYWTTKYVRTPNIAIPRSLEAPKASDTHAINWASALQKNGTVYKALKALPAIGGVAPDVGLSSGAYYIYWTSPSENTIWFGHFGKGWESLGVFLKTPDPKAIVIDASEGKIYWSSDDGIHRANLQDGSDAQLIYPGVQADVLALQPYSY